MEQQEEKKKVYMNAVIMGASIKKQGVNKKGENWTLYKYELGVGKDGTQKRFCSSFIKFDMGDTGYFMFLETDNPQNEKFPYLQIVKRIGDIKEEVAVKDGVTKQKQLVTESETQAKSMIVHKIDIDVFKNAYFEKFGTEKGKAHFVAAYLAKTNPKLFKSLSTVFDGQV